MKQYRISTVFETLYTHEKETKIEITRDFQAALNCYIIRIENPEVTFCSIDVMGENESVGKIIAAFNSNALH